MVAMNHIDNYQVLLIGGGSGMGKTTVAAELGRQLGIPWFQVDDLRLALQRSRVTFPGGSDALNFFADIDDKPHIWQEPPLVLRDALIAVGEILSPGLEAMIENHADQGQPIIIEGDGILPSLLARPALRKRASDNQVRAVFLIESDEDVLFSNMQSRARTVAYMSEVDLRAEAHAKMLFGQWLIGEAGQFGLPVLETRPWDTLTARIMAALKV